MRVRRSHPVLLVVLLIAVLAATTTAALAGRASSATLCTSVALSTGAGGNGLTGGTIQYIVSLTNTGRLTCVLEGRPWVRVSPTRYPVIVDDLRPGTPGGGPGSPGRILTLAPGQKVKAFVLMSRAACNFRKSDAATLAVRIGWFRRSVTTRGEACLREGATVFVGPFQR
jgi:Protein of unknown function (DUF4232)